MASTGAASIHFVIILVAFRATYPEGCCVTALWNKDLYLPGLLVTFSFFWVVNEVFGAYQKKKNLPFNFGVNLKSFMA